MRSILMGLFIGFSMTALAWAEGSARGGVGDIGTVRDGIYQIGSASWDATYGNNGGACHPDVVQRPAVGFSDSQHVGVLYTRMVLKVTDPGGMNQYWDVSRCLPSALPGQPYDTTIAVSNTENFGHATYVGFATDTNHVPSNKSCRSFEKVIYPEYQFSSEFLHHHESCMALQTLVHDQIIIGQKPVTVKVTHGEIVVPPTN